MSTVMIHDTHITVKPGSQHLKCQSGYSLTDQDLNPAISKGSLFPLIHFLILSGQHTIKHVSEIMTHAHSILKQRVDIF